MDGHGGLAGTLAEAVYLGAATQYVVALPDGTHVTVRRPIASGAEPLAPGTPVHLAWTPDDASVLIGQGTRVSIR